jgi:hypothetical protein
LQKIRLGRNQGSAEVRQRESRLGDLGRAAEPLSPPRVGPLGGNAKLLLLTDIEGRGVIQIGDQFGNPVLIITSESRASAQPVGAGSTHGVLSIRSAVWFPDREVVLQDLATIGGVSQWINKGQRIPGPN